MTAWALIPVKARGEGKSRLAGALPAQERAALTDAMLRHVVDAADHAKSLDRVLLVGPVGHNLDPHIPLLEDPGGGLNAALEIALAQIASAHDRPDRLVIVAADLPCLTSFELDLLAEVPAGSLAIAPDRYGSGTNAISLPLPEGTGFHFHYGPASAVAHRKEAERLALNVETILCAGLAKDIDEPSDLVDAAQVYSTAR